MLTKKLLLGFFAGALLTWTGNAVFAEEEISEEELNEIRQKADGGDGEALNDLGVCYIFGNGVKKDEKKAFELFRKSSEKGYPSGIYNYANCYYEGLGTEKNISKAMPLLQKASEAGSVKACSLLGACYLIGRGVEKDLDKGLDLTRKAAEEGDSQAEYNLGFCYQEGIGVDKDLELAEKWFTKAAKDGDKTAEEALKALKAPAAEPKIYTDAKEIPEDYEKIGSTEIEHSETSVSFSITIGKKSEDSDEKKMTLREEVLEQARQKKADAVLILKEKGNSANGYISAEFYKK